MRYLIIGNAAAGIAAAGAVRMRDSGARVLIISDESHPAYFRPLITTLIENGIGKEALLRDPRTIPPGVEFRLGTSVEAIEPRTKSVLIKGGESVQYDRLLLATGSSALRPSIQGLDGLGVYVLRTVSDAEAIREAAETASRCVVVGGGRVGMKAALALRKRGLEVTVVEQGDRVVPLQFDHPAAEIVGSAIEGQGIRLVLEKTVKQVDRSNGAIEQVILTDGSRLEADLVVVAVGITPNGELARQAGLEVNEGIVVNRLLQTSDPDVFAAGDVVETTDIVTGKSIIAGTWTDATAMGRTAGINMAGGNLDYAGSLIVRNSFELAGIPTVSVGLIAPEAETDYDVFTLQQRDSYRKLVLKKGRLVGALMVGEIEGAGVYTGLIERKANVERHMDALLARRPSYAPWLKRDLAVDAVQTQ
jgi:nitrite reductase (NADH) large subunit